MFNFIHILYVFFSHSISFLCSRELILLLNTIVQCYIDLISIPTHIKKPLKKVWGAKDKINFLSFFLFDGMWLAIETHSLPSLDS